MGVRLFFVWAIVCGSMALAAEELSRRASVRLTFTASSPADSPAADEYRAIWASEGVRIVDTMQKRAGLHFQESEILVIVVEAPSESGYGPRPMRLRSSYPTETKKGTLIHELGHRLQSRFFRKQEEDHPYLFLYLYDVWVDLYGCQFADHQVEVESLRKGYYDYKKAWREALAMTPSQRFTKWQTFLYSRQQH